MATKAAIFKWTIPVFLILLSAIVIFMLRESTELPPKHSSKPSLSRILGGAAEGYTKATEPITFEFPRDHGAHPEFRNEWWYFTGNLQTPDGRLFGYQFTLFRTSISPDSVSRSSQWATREIYMGHFALTDVQQSKYQHFERFSRAALQLAGAQVLPFRVWLEDWSVQSVADSFFPLRIQASAGELSLDLELTSQKELILQGNQGLSQKGNAPGNASYYYSYTRLSTQGQLQIGDQHFQLHGLSWMDREWSSSALESNQIGWDWIALQLSNGWDLMFYQLRLKDGRIDPNSSGVLVSPEGHSHTISAKHFFLQNLDYWHSPTSGIRYPSRWSLTIPQYEVTLSLLPLLNEQEFHAVFTYWEGAVRCEGTFQAQSVQGHGYVELTGYLPHP